MKYPAYPKYKDSGVEWLGEVPEHWEVKRLKNVATSFKAGPFGSSLTKDMYSDSGYRVYGQEQVIPGDFAIGDYYISEGIFAELKQYEVKQDDILISCVGTFGKIAVVPGGVEPGIINPRLIKITTCSRVYPVYLATILRSGYVYEQLSLCSRGGTMDIINIGMLSEVIIPVPPRNEQERIESYLQRKTSKLDTLIAKKRGLIDKLKEKRAALITRTVTRGLPPDAATAAGLDPHPKMKDSGVEWLGEVPEHWDVMRLKNIVDSIQIGPFGGMLTEVVDSQTGVKLYGQENIISGNFEIGFRWITEGLQYLFHKYDVKPGDILITRKGSLGHSKIFPSNHELGIIDSDTIRIRADRAVALNRYMQIILNNSSFTEAQVDMNKRGAILSGVNTAVISGLIMCVPPLEEQDVIIKFLDRETAAIDALVAKVETAIERLQEYRAALITAAVTGQIDVREAVQ